MTTQRRRRAWSDVRVNQVNAANVGSVPIDLGIQQVDKDVKTAVRVIGDLTGFPDDRNAAVDGVMQIEGGIGVASEEAFTAQVVPDPNAQSEYPALGWLYMASRVVIFNNSSGTTEVLEPATFHFDIRANRKVDRGRLYFVWNNTTADGTGFQVTLVGRIRTLFLL